MRSWSSSSDDDDEIGRDEEEEEFDDLRFPNELSPRSKKKEIESRKELAVAAAEMMGVWEESSSDKERGCINVFDATFNGLVDALIRPSRAEYAYSDLGPSCGRVGQYSVRRDDFTLKNGRGKKLHGSWWKFSIPTSSTRSNGYQNSKKKTRSIILYLHANSSSRIEALRAGLLRACAGAGGADLVAFDFAGSGWSEGHYVTLGYFERYDVADVIHFIKTQISSTVVDKNDHTDIKIILWGRSMGATTALLYAALPGTQADGLILDSPFLSVKVIVQDLVSRGKFRLPKFAARAILAALRNATFKRTGGAQVVDVDLTRPMHGLDAREWLALAAVCRSGSRISSLKSKANSKINSINNHEFTSTQEEVKRTRSLSEPNKQNGPKYKPSPNILTAACDSVRVPCLFFGGESDDFIPPSIHLDAIRDAIIKAKKIRGDLSNTCIAYRFDGGHNEPRPAWVRDVATTFARAIFYMRPHKKNVDDNLLFTMDPAIFRSTLDTTDLIASHQLDHDLLLNDLRLLVATKRSEEFIIQELLIFAASLTEAKLLATFGAYGTNTVMTDNFIQKKSEEDDGIILAATNQIACHTALNYFGLSNWPARAIVPDASSWGLHTAEEDLLQQKDRQHFAVKEDDEEQEDRLIKQLLPSPLSPSYIPQHNHTFDDGDKATSQFSSPLAEPYQIQTPKLQNQNDADEQNGELSQAHKSPT